MTDSSFAAFTTTVYTRKRANLSGVFETGAGILGTPFAPVDTETRQRLELNTPHTIYETHFQDTPDILKGDRLVSNSIEYPVRHVEPYTWLPTGDKRVRVIVEDTRNR